MTREEVCKQLCIKDKRNPDNELWYYQEWMLEDPEPRTDCYCDNCFHGRDRLAVEILKLMDKKV